MVSIQLQYSFNLCAIWHVLTFEFVSFCLCQGGNVSCLCPSVCPVVHKQDYTNSFVAVFMKAGRIVDYCCVKHPSNFGVDLTENGQLRPTILDFHYNA